MSEYLSFLHAAQQLGMTAHGLGRAVESRRIKADFDIRPELRRRHADPVGRGKREYWDLDEVPDPGTVPAWVDLDTARRMLAAGTTTGPVRNTKRAEEGKVTPQWVAVQARQGSIVARFHVDEVQRFLDERELVLGADELDKAAIVALIGDSGFKKARGAGLLVATRKAGRQGQTPVYARSQVQALLPPEGYVPPAEVARTAGVSREAVRRWALRNEKWTRTILDRTYVNLQAYLDSRDQSAQKSGPRPKLPRVSAEQRREDERNRRLAEEKAQAFRRINAWQDQA